VADSGAGLVSETRISPQLALGFITASAVLWALQPAFVLAAGRLYPTLGLGFVTLNLAVATAMAGVAVLWKTPFTTRRYLGQSALARRRLFLFCSADGAFVALAYVLLLHASDIENISGSAILFESWPMFAALGLLIVLPKKADRPNSTFVSVGLFLLGFAFLSLDNFRLTDFASLRAQLFLPVLSALCLAAAVVIIQALFEREPHFKAPASFFVVMLVRNLAAFVFLAVATVLAGAPALTIAAPAIAVIALTLVIAALVFFNSVFYHVGVAHAPDNAAALVGLLSPVLAPIFIAVVGFWLKSLESGPLSREFLVGAAFIIGGIAVTSRADDNTVNYKIVLSATLGVGAIILMTGSRGSQAYYAYLGATAIFYGIMQGNILTHLKEARDASSALQLRIKRERLAWRRPNGQSPVRRETVRALANQIRDIRWANSSLSELLLLTAFFITNSGVLLHTRPPDLEGNVSAYLIVTVSLYLLGISWRYYIEVFSNGPKIAAFVGPNGFQRGKRVLGRRMLRYRLFSHVTLVAVFLWFFFLILWFAPPPA
jgi:drug/metabolite transporter (DMT)-like permease